MSESDFVTLHGTPIAASLCHLLQFDGSAQPNPGPATAAAVLFSPYPRTLVAEQGEFLGSTTNNQAEYVGLILGLRRAAEAGVRNLLIEGDSQLIVFQVQRKWKVNHAELRPRHAEVLALLPRFESVAIRHVRREFNAHADRITNLVQQTRKSYRNPPT